MLGLATFGQTNQIKVKKPLTQDKMTTVVTLTGLYYGKSSVNKILSDKKLKLSSTADKIKIVDFDIDVFSKESGIQLYHCKSDTLSEEVIMEINSLKESNRIRLYLSPIRATTADQDTVFLNPIELYLTK